MAGLDELGYREAEVAVSGMRGGHLFVARSSSRSSSSSSRRCPSARMRAAARAVYSSAAAFHIAVASLLRTCPRSSTARRTAVAVLKTLSVLCLPPRYNYLDAVTFRAV